MRVGDAVWCLYPSGARARGRIVAELGTGGLDRCHAHPGALAYVVVNEDSGYRGVYCAPQLDRRVVAVPGGSL